MNLAPEVGRWGGGGSRGCGEVVGAGGGVVLELKLNLKSTTTFKNKEILERRQSELNLEKSAKCILLHPFFKSFSFRDWITEYSQYKDRKSFIHLLLSSFLK